MSRKISSPYFDIFISRLTRGFPHNQSCRNVSSRKMLPLMRENIWINGFLKHNMSKQGKFKVPLMPTWICMWRKRTRNRNEDNKSISIFSFVRRKM